MQEVFPYIKVLEDDEMCIYLLIQMTNEYIDYRNQLFDGVCNQHTKQIENEEDYHYVAEMDRKIETIIKYLDDV